MKRSPRAAALEAFAEFYQTGFLPQPDFEDPRDQRLFTQIVKGVFRHRLILDAELKNHLRANLRTLHGSVLSILQIGAFELLFLRTPAYAVVDEAVNLVPPEHDAAKGLVNAVLRRVSEAAPRFQHTPSLDNSLPPDLALAWSDALGKGLARKAATTIQSEAPLVLRTNLLRTSVEKLESALKEAGGEVERSKVVPEALLLRKNPNLSELAPFRDGWFYIQNEASQLITHLLDPKPEDKVLDLCAAPGGKSTHIAEFTGDKAKITAVDASRPGLRRLEENLQRLGTTSVRIVQSDAFEYTSWNPFDRVLLDAPCSAWGVLREHPEWRWNKDARNPARQADTQLSLLEHAIQLVKPGGICVYSVCTFSAEETTQLIGKFLKRCPYATLEEPREFLPEGAKRYANESFFQTVPGNGDMDGFFAARLRRTR